MPTEIDVVERRMRQLEIERVALAKETDDASQERLAKLDEELANLREQSDAMKAHWQAEKEAIAAIRALKEELEAKRPSDGRARGTTSSRRPRSATARSPSWSGRSRRPPRSWPSCRPTQKMLKEEVDARGRRRGRQPSGPASP